MACIVAGKIEDPHAKNQGIILITNGLNAQGYDLKRWEDLVEDLEEGEVRDHIRLKILALHVEGREIELAKQMLSKIKTKYSKDCAIYELCIYLADKGRIQEIPLEEILEMANPSYIPVYICNSHSSLEEKDDFFEQLSLKFLEKEKLDLAFQYAGLIANSSKREKVRLCLFNDYCRFFPLDQVYERLMTLQDQPEFGSLVSGVCQFYCEKGNLHDQEQVNNFIRKVNRHV